MKRLIAGSLSLALSASTFLLAETPARLPATLPHADPVALQEDQPKPEEIPTKPREKPKPSTEAVNPCANQNQPIDKDACLIDCHLGECCRLWFDAGYLLMWYRNGSIPFAAVTTGATGVLGPGTSVLVGNQSIDYGTQHGIRLNGGFWLNERHTIGIELSGFVLGSNSESTTIASTGGTPLLARPFTDAIVNAQNAMPISTPGTLNGSVLVDSNSQLWGSEINFVRNLVHNRRWDIDALFGFRQLQLQESLGITSTSTVLPGGAFVLPGGLNPVIHSNPGDTLVVADRIGARNQFYGGQIGARSSWKRDALFVDTSVKVGFGPNYEKITAMGSSSSGSTTIQGGLLALSGTNIGANSDRRFTVVPELNLQVGYHFMPNIWGMVGYNFLYMNNIARPGDQVNVNVNQGFVPSSLAFGSNTGIPQPRPVLNQSEFWAHGLNFTLGISY